MTNITLISPGPREVVTEKRAREIIAHWKDELSKIPKTAVEGEEKKDAASSSSSSSSDVVGTNNNNNDNSKENLIVCDKIVLSNKSYTAEAATLIAAFLISKGGGTTYKQPLCSTVKVVDLSDIIASRMEDEGLQVLRTLCDAFKHSSLVEVNLSDNAMGSKGIKACASVLSGQSSSLERLSMCNNGLSEFSMNEVAEILCGGLDDGENAANDGENICERLTKIHFYNNMSGNGGCRAFAQIMSKCTSKLEDIRFSGTRAGREGSLFISSALENLGQQIVNLKRLDLADNSFGSDGGSTLAKALRRCVSLTHLNLRDCVLEDDATGEVCRAVWTSDAPLELLDLSGNEITKKGAKSIAELIEETGSTLRVLHCEENEMTSKGVMYIAAALGEQIEEILLGCNECGSVGASALITANGIKGDGLPSLQSIHLDGNMFPKSDVQQLMETFGEKLMEMEDNDEDGDIDDDLSEDEEEDEDDDDDDEDDDDEDEREFEQKNRNENSVDALTKAMAGAKIDGFV